MLVAKTRVAVASLHYADIGTSSRLQVIFNYALTYTLVNLSVITSSVSTKVINQIKLFIKYTYSIISNLQSVIFYSFSTIFILFYKFVTVVAGTGHILNL